ncbi:MAG: 4-hydroxy-tetrahydrodipicolinate reductase [Gammaproteobacteria bacterium]|nr:4-hydroxy-tetrahydrodipicolinate reductase [Gammaproteobacteria bacterium]MDH5629777.1 4-hydroxy-tetrahydrodipicolinate reductase [Gammaproteobacteria bacterium]
MGKTKIAVNAASGRMGQHLLAEVNHHRQAELIAAVCRENHRLLGRQVNGSAIVYQSNLKEALEKSQVAIDFSLPEASVTFAKQASISKTPVLIGTTGFADKHLKTLKSLSKSIPVLVAPNTSVGINSMLNLLQQATKMLGKKADIEIIEAHHKHKLDAPSGTAIRMGETIAKELGKTFDSIAATKSRFERRERGKDEIGVSVIRAGEIIGEHKVIFALDNEIITLEHKANNRRCFAEGAVEAAIWLSKQPPGYYSMQDFVNR